MRRSGSHLLAPSITCVLGATLLAGCAAIPTRRPLQTTAVESGVGSTESVRKQLEGTWTLASFTVFDTSGPPRTVDASGRLTYDAYGNLQLAGTLTNPAAGAGAEHLSFQGRAVVDAVARRIVLAEVTGNVAALPATMSPDKVRFYTFEGDTLALETRDGARVLARTVWRKAP